MTRWFTVWVEHPDAPVELVEQWPSQRRVIDGTTRLLARRLDASSDADRRKLDGVVERGCPIWEP